MPEKVSELVKKELGIEKAKISEEDKTKGVTSIGSLSMQQVVKIAKEKMSDLFVKDLKSAVKQILGTVNSMQGILVEEKTPKEIIEEVNEGKWDEIIFKEDSTESSNEKEESE
jgi:large subunit ribosomal protein L11